MRSYRLTYAEEELTGSDAFNEEGILNRGVEIELPCRAEIRDNTGQVLRLTEGTVIKQERTQVGDAITTAEGELCQLFANDHHKYVTSCYAVPSYETTAPSTYVITPGSRREDVYRVLFGDVTIYDFDESNETFQIATAREGEKVELGYDPEERGPERYKAEVSRMDGDEFEEYMDRFVNSSGWGFERDSKVEISPPMRQ